MSALVPASSVTRLTGRRLAELSWAEVSLDVDDAAANSNFRANGAKYK